VSSDGATEGQGRPIIITLAPGESKTTEVGKVTLGPPIRGKGRRQKIVIDRTEVDLRRIGPDTVQT